MFTDVSDRLGHNPSRMHSGVAVADREGDGRFEFLIGGWDGPNRLLRWSGNQLRDVTPPEVADADHPTLGVSAGDVDSDGREELYLLNAANGSLSRRTVDKLLKSCPDSRWDDLLARHTGCPLNHTADGGIAAIDRRGVGRYGFFVAGSGNPSRFYELGPGGILADLAVPLGLAATSDCRGALALPMFDLHPDLLSVNQHGPNFVYRNQGDGTFAECAAELGLADSAEHACGVAAFDVGNGALGLCWGNTDGPHRLMIPQADGTWKDRATAALAFPSAIRTIIAADFDNDGHDELFFNTFGEPNRLFRIVADSQVLMLDAGAALDPDGFGTGAAVCDIDRDGILELLVARGEREPQPLSIYKSREAKGNNWLRVRPLTRFGAPARGAVVRAEAGPRVRIKSICGGCGYLGQMEPVAHFGFGPDLRPERVQITWPDGAGVMLLNPGVNRVVTVPYPRG